MKTTYDLGHAVSLKLMLNFGEISRFYDLKIKHQLKKKSTIKLPTTNINQNRFQNLYFFQFLTGNRKVIIVGK